MSRGGVCRYANRYARRLLGLRTVPAPLPDEPWARRLAEDRAEARGKRPPQVILNVDGSAISLSGEYLAGVWSQSYRFPSPAAAAEALKSLDVQKLEPWLGWMEEKPSSLDPAVAGLLEKRSISWRLMLHHIARRLAERR